MHALYIESQELANSLIFKEIQEYFQEIFCSCDPSLTVELWQEWGISA